LRRGTLGGRRALIRRYDDPLDLRLARRRIGGTAARAGLYAFDRLKLHRVRLLADTNCDGFFPLRITDSSRWRLWRRSLIVIQHHDTGKVVYQLLGDMLPSNVAVSCFSLGRSNLAARIPFASTAPAATAASTPAAPAAPIAVAFLAGSNRAPLVFAPIHVALGGVLELVRRTGSAVVDTFAILAELLSGGVVQFTTFLATAVPVAVAASAPATPATSASAFLASFAALTAFPGTRPIAVARLLIVSFADELRTFRSRGTFVFNAGVTVRILALEAPVHVDGTPL
jgi:hypothetical protein